MIKSRFLIEGCIFSLFTGLPSLLIPVSSTDMRVTISIVFFGIPIVLGVHGINGDSLSVVLKSAWSWLRTRGIMLYNHETVALKMTPLDGMQSERRVGDTLVNVIDNMVEARKRRLDEVEYVEGVTFKFAEDPTLKKLYADRLEQETDIYHWPEENEAAEYDEPENTTRRGQKPTSAQPHEYIELSFSEGEDPDEVEEIPVERQSPPVERLQEGVELSFSEDEEPDLF